MKKVSTKKKENKSFKKWDFSIIVNVILMLIWVFASLIVSQLIVGMIMVKIIGLDEMSRPLPTAIYSALSYVISMCLIVFVPVLLSKKNKRKSSKLNTETSREGLGLNDMPTWTDIGLAPVGFFVYLLIAAVLTSIFTLFPWYNASEAQDVGFNIYISGVDRAIAFFVLVVIAPIAEEIIFRGWLYGKLRETTLGNLSDKLSVVVSTLLVSLLFGLVHMQWNVGVNVFAMSLVLCALREITGTIYAGILLHMLKNGIAFYLLYIIGIT